MGKTSGKWAIGAIFAGAAGFLAGILTAPKSGKETRQDIKAAAKQGITEAEKRLKVLHTQMNETISQAKEKVKGLKGDTQKELQAAIERAAVVKEKARTLLSSIHEGDAEDKDLKKAIDEATKAVDHLKTYLKG